MPVFYVKVDSYLYSEFSEDFDQPSSGSDDTVQWYSVPDPKWGAFRNRFNFSSHSKIYYYEPTAPGIDELDEIAKNILASDRTRRYDASNYFRAIGSVRDRNLLYLLIGGSPDVPSEGSEDGLETETAGIMVIRSYTDVIEIRTGSGDRADAIYRLISREFDNWAVSPELSRPSFDEGFRSQFNERLAEEYTKVWFRNKGGDDPVNIIHFQGREDLRNSEIVDNHFDRKQPYAGFVKIIGVPQTEFHFNWREDRISFQGATREAEMIEASNQIIGLLDLQKGYPVIRTFYQGEPVRAEVHDSYFTAVWPAAMGFNEFIQYVRSREIPPDSPVIVHPVEGSEVQTELGEIESSDLNDVAFARVYAAAKGNQNSDYTWERHGNSTLVGIASESGITTPFSRIYDSTTNHQLDEGVSTVLNRFGEDLDLEENYD